MSHPPFLVRKYFLFLLGFTLTFAASAQLSWENQTVDIGFKPGQKEVRGVYRTAFRFTNTGKTPVSITNIEPSCGCVLTQLEKMDYAPGESGEMKITFEVELDTETGIHNKTIKVTTTDKPKSPTTLNLRVNIPELLVVKPKFIGWSRKEKPVAKEILVKPGKGMGKLTLKKPYPISEDFAVEVLPDESGKRFRVKITPQSGGKSCYAQIRLQATLSEMEEPVDLKINAAVE